jgi:hypothetical protein
MKTTSKSKVEKEGTVAVKRVREEKAKEEQYHKGYCKAVEDICNSLKALDSLKAVYKKNK